MGELKKRVLAGSILAPVVAAIFCFPPPLWLFFFLAFVAILALHEMASMAGLKSRPLIAVLAVISFLPLYFRSFEIYAIWQAASALLYMLVRLFMGGAEEEGINGELMKGVAVIIFGEVFIALPLFSIYLIKEIGAFFPFVLLLALWASDIGAFTMGKNFGKHPLAPQISPKKTYEGLFGAVLGSTVIIAVSYRFLGFGIVHAILTGAIIGILGQAGDLMESAAKRVTGIKDSSTLIPGHGGILDRMDSFIFAAPYFYFSILRTM